MAKVDIEITNLFRTEYSNLVAVLCHYYGMANIQSAEDIVSETFLLALKTWSHKGIPQMPKAWLRKVAVNKARDLHRRNAIFENKVTPNHDNIEIDDPSEVFTNEILSDSQLHMMFVVCHERLKIESQICLALRLLCGFGIDEIASALLSNKAAINKTLYRSKKKLAQERDLFKTLDHQDFQARLDAVLRIIYLIFNEGYYSSHPDHSIRKDLCWEAMRLCKFLSEQDHFRKDKVYALMALMCFHASRLDSRLNSAGQYILYHDQDKTKWNQELIHLGNRFLSKSSHAHIVSKYHLEAAIAYWHTTESEEKWNRILQLYNKLLILEFSPVIAMNRTYALARANSVDEALHEALKLEFKDNHLYYSLLAELYHMINNFAREIFFLKKAIEYAKNEQEMLFLHKKLNMAIKLDQSSLYHD